jgi:signal transduction histidine kinase
VRAEGDRAVIEVANGGAVIAPELVARLAEPFQRLDRSGATRGAGLGLSIVRAVAEAHGGWLTLDAPRTGGLQARVVLPVAVDRSRPRRREWRARNSPAARSVPRT